MTCTRLRDPVLRLVAATCGLSLIGLITIAVPTADRRVPVQHVRLPGGGEVWLPDAAHSRPFIPDADASCPSLLLLLLLLLGCACTTLVNGHSLPSAFDAGAVYLGAQALSGCLTAWYKTYCGYLRPNYLEGCGWNATTHACAHEWPEGRLSFPSGHSSSSAAGASVLTLYLLRRLSDAASQRSPWKRRALALAVPLPGAIAGWVAASRVHDNWHFPADVAAGAALGAACGALVFSVSAPAPPRSRSSLLGHNVEQSDSATASASASGGD